MTLPANSDILSSSSNQVLKVQKEVFIMNTLKSPKPIDALCDSIQTEDLSNALAELMPFSVSSSKFYVWAPETDRDDGMVKAQELYNNMLDDKQNN